MTRACIPTVGALAIALWVGIVGAVDEPVTLRFKPEKGLAVTYDFDGRGQMSMSAPGGGERKAEALHLTGRFTDTIVAVEGAKRTVERRFTELSAEVAGQTQQAPDTAKAARRFVLDGLGRAVESPGSGAGPPSMGPMPVDVTSAAMGFIPFPEKAVGVGDSWDNSETFSPAGMPGLKPKVTTSLVGLYESGGMDVALTQTEFRAEGPMAVPMPAGGGASAPEAHASLRGAVLQSTRIEDGCLLGMKATMSATVQATIPGVGDLTFKLDDFRARIQVAEAGR